MTMADPLPGLNFAAGGTPLTDETRRMLDGLDTDSEPGRRVLAVLALQLAQTIDGAAHRGRASAAAMAAKELQACLATLRELAEADPAEGALGFDAWRVELIDSIEKAATA